MTYLATLNKIRYERDYRAELVVETRDRIKKFFSKHLRGPTVVELKNILPKSRLKVAKVSVYGLIISCYKLEWVDMLDMANGKMSIVSKDDLAGLTAKEKIFLLKGKNTKGE